MSCEETPDDQIGESLLIRNELSFDIYQSVCDPDFLPLLLVLINARQLHISEHVHRTADLQVVMDQIEEENIIKGKNIPIPPLPVVQPLPNKQCQKMVDQLGQSVRIIGDSLNREQQLNHQIDGLARLGDKKIFPKIVEGVFSDGQINWGRIIVLFYTVGKLAVKMMLAHLPTEFSEILDSCLDFFRTKLLGWIRNMGGWINSISALTQFSVEHISASSFCTIQSAKLVTAFVCGTLLGSFIVWKFIRSS